MKNHEFKARASGAGSLMIGGTSFTGKDKERLSELEDRKNGTFLNSKGKPMIYSDNMKYEHAHLVEKKAKGFQLGKTSKSFIEDVWLYNRYGYKELFTIDETLKGNICEQDIFRLADEVLPVSVLRSKSKDRKENDFFTGQCDISLDKEDLIEDAKASFTLRTFFKIESYPELYYAQGQVYMDLYEKSNFRLIYGLVNTPEFIIEGLERRMFYKYGGDENNSHYIKACKQIRQNHNYDHIPSVDKIKVFEFERNDEYINEMKKRVVLARKYYDGLRLTDFKESNNLLQAA